MQFRSERSTLSSSQHTLATQRRLGSDTGRRIPRLIQNLANIAALLAWGVSAAQANPNFTADFREGLGFIPLNAESVVATLQPFLVPKLTSDSQIVPPFEEVLKMHLLGNVVSGKPLPLWALLEGKQVLWAMTAKRAQEVKKRPGTRIIELGVHPYESVAIAKFRDPIPSAFMEALHSDFQAEMRNGVSVFRSKNDRVAILLPRPDLLVSISILSTSDAMLDDVTKRIAITPSDYLFESADVAWSLSNLESTFWGLRKSKNDQGRYEDANGRDWILFSFDTKNPQSALFRSVLSDDAKIGKGSPWLGFPDQETTKKDLGLIARIQTNSRYVDTTVECLPEARDQCLVLPFLIEAFGVMVWI
jgi:hypothetical protein